MITDGILFHDESALLEVRIRELWPVVDQFVVVEMPVTISGEPKDYVSDTEGFQQAIGAYSEKVRIIRLTKVPLEVAPWASAARRRMMSEAVMQAATPGAPIMLSETWRIPKLEAVVNLQGNLGREFQVSCLHLRPFWWSFWGRSGGAIDRGVVCVPYSKAAHHGLYHAWENRHKARRIIDAGWSLRGFRHPDDAFSEFNCSDDVSLFNFTGDKVRESVGKSETPEGDRIFWNRPTEDCVPQCAWDARKEKLFPMFDDPREGVVAPDRIENIPKTLQFPKVGT